MPRSEALALIGIGGLAIIGVIICAVVKVAIPNILGDLALVAISGGAGASLPSRTVVPTPQPPMVTPTP